MRYQAALRPDFLIFQAGLPVEKGSTDKVRNFNYLGYSRQLKRMLRKDFFTEAFIAQSLSITVSSSNSLIRPPISSFDTFGDSVVAAVTSSTCSPSDSSF